MLGFVLFLLSGCGYNLFWTKSGNKYPQKNTSPKELSQKIIPVRIAPTFETGKFSFQGLALLENGKILGVGYDGENPRRMRASSDRGTTWETDLFTTDFTMPTSIFFKDNQNGWIVGSMNVFKTTDGGQNWKKIFLGAYLSTSTISFYDLKTGFLTGRNNIEGEVSSQIFLTTDGGETWVRCYENSKQSNPFAILAVSEHTALAILNENYLIRTDDAGKSWKRIESYNYRTNNVLLDFNSRVWAVGRDGSFLFSLDKGFTWQRPIIFPKNLESISWNSISFVNSKIGFAVGEKGAFILTEDSGNSWKEIQANLTEDLYEIYTNQSFGIIKGDENLFKIEF